MKRIDQLIRIAAATLLAGALLASCSDVGEEEAVYLPDSICVNTLAVGSDRVPKTDVDDNTFTVLFWRSTAHLESDFDNTAAWPEPYLAGHAPQPVSFYEHSVYDLRYPYPTPETAALYATGYAPGSVLAPANGTDYRTLNTTSELNPAHLGRYDFMCCDVWSEVYRGSRSDPFAQDRNKLYFRHLAAKLIFRADRDRATMENRQFVRDVRITNLCMSIDGGTTWTSMYTPSGFEWRELTDHDFTEPYNNTIETVKTIPANLEVTTRPKAGYKTVEAAGFAGRPDPVFTLQRNPVDRVPIDGMDIDSCYVCNPYKEGAVQIGQAIRLRMDISAEMSYDPNFPQGDAPGDGSGSVTDNLTFTRTWTDVTIGSIERVDAAGNPTGEAAIDEFKPGHEYRIYIHFHRTGVDLVARELPWNDGGSHYIPIPGGDGTEGGDQPGTDPVTPTGSRHE